MSRKYRYYRSHFRKSFVHF